MTKNGKKNYKELIKENKFVVLFIIISSTIFLLSGFAYQPVIQERPAICSETNDLVTLGSFALVSALIALGWLFARLRSNGNKGVKNE